LAVSYVMSSPPEVHGQKKRREQEFFLTRLLQKQSYTSTLLSGCSLRSSLGGFEVDPQWWGPQREGERERKADVFANQP